MKIFYSLNDFVKSRTSTKRFISTIGIFDGMHRAHQRIIKALIKKAKIEHLSSLLITFDPHPINILNSSKKVPLLISLKHRLHLLQDLGLDCVMVIRFDKKLSQLGAPDFIKKVIGKIRIKEIIVGRNFFFGKDKKGSLKSLRRFSKMYGYKISVIPALKSSGKIISSTWIRKLILNGDLKKAESLLSRPVTVLGTVVKGERRGRDLGFPTANVDPHHEAIPPSGVYAVKIKLANKLYNGILNIGIKPTFGDMYQEPIIEVHIFNFNKSIYGKDLEIIFVKKIRDEKRFKNIAILKEQIKKDEKRVKRTLHRRRI